MKALFVALLVGLLLGSIVLAANGNSVGKVSQRDRTYFTTAIKINNPGYCGAIYNQAVKDRCYMILENKNSH